MDIVMNLKSAFAAAALAFASAMSPVARYADPITYYFTVDGSGGKLGGNLAPPNSYGSVTVTSFGLDLEFDIALDPNWSVDTGSHHAVAFALATSGLTISGSPGSLSPLTVPFVQNPNTGPFSNPNFAGPFNYAIECSGAGHGQNSCNDISSLTFYVLGAGNLSPILTNGVYVTADIYSNATGRTGVVGATLAPVPGPIVGAGLPGMCAAMGALVMLARRRRRIALS